MATVMQLKILLLLIGLCAISCNQVVAENEEGMFYIPFRIVNLPNYPSGYL